MKTVFVFKPDNLEDDKIGFLQGICSRHDDSLAFYITNNRILETQDANNIIGYCSLESPKKNIGEVENAEWIHINSETGEVTFQNHTGNQFKIVPVMYNFKTFCASEIEPSNSKNYGEFFETLWEATRVKKTQAMKNVKVQYLVSMVINLVVLMSQRCVNVLHAVNTKFQYSTTLHHFESKLFSLKMLFLEFQTNRKLTLKCISSLVSICLDTILGIIASYYLLGYFNEIVDFAHNTAEYIIYLLKQLLTILMGSPAGLKLNYAFNNALGHFFFYHIALWRAFIFAINLLLPTILEFFIVFASVGISFQLAMLSDFIAFATFHVYCIYVYAARLYWLQIRALISLWRLFIGRKYNPLRERVDSCEYTPPQLFIGTLGFTIFLFLLPTTLLYYSVFTIFRVGIILVNKTLCSIRRLIEHFPLYIIFLWILNSPSVSCSIYLSTEPSKTNEHVLEVTLRKVSFLKTVKLCSNEKLPPQSQVSLGTIFHRMITGVLI